MIYSTVSEKSCTDVVKTMHKQIFVVLWNLNARCYTHKHSTVGYYIGCRVLKIDHNMVGPRESPYS